MPAHPSKLDGLATRSEAGRPRLRDARPRRNETRALVIAAMAKLDRAVTSAEVYGMLDGEVLLGTIKYQLSTLVKVKVAEIVLGPELRFRLIPGSDAWKSPRRERCR
jgi:hypothetical protein